VITAAASAEKRAEEISADGALGKPFEARDFIKVAQTHLSCGT